MILIMILIMIMAAYDRLDPRFSTSYPIYFLHFLQSRFYEDIWPCTLRCMYLNPRCTVVSLQFSACHFLFFQSFSLFLFLPFYSRNSVLEPPPPPSTPLTLARVLLQGGPQHDSNDSTCSTLHLLSFNSICTLFSSVLPSYWPHWPYSVLHCT